MKGTERSRKPLDWFQRVKRMSENRMEKQMLEMRNAHRKQRIHYKMDEHSVIIKTKKTMMG